MGNENQNSEDEYRKNVYKDIKRGLSDFFVSAKYVYTSKYIGYDSAMKKVLQNYKREMLHWMTEGKASYENSMKSVSQEHWYYLYLEKKRLEERRLQVEYEDYKHIGDNIFEAPETSFLYRPDGKYLVCRATETTKIKKNYIRDGAIVGKEQDSHVLNYYILRAQTKDGLYVCQNCGAEQPMDKLIDGCDYCGTLLDISAYEDKVTSVTRHNNTFEDRTVIENNTPPSAMLFAILGTLAVFFGLMFVPCTLGISLLGVALGAWAIYYSFELAIDANKDVPQAGSIKYRLQDNNPDFCEEEFIGSLDCKIKSIHYASNVGELSAFVKCDIEPYVKRYQDIINCEPGRIAYKWFEVKDGYQYLVIHREMHIMRDCNDHLKTARGVVKITLCKKADYKFKSDIVLYRCKCCGATLSLLEGGICDYCGNEIDYMSYDWVIVDYEHVKCL